MPATEPYHRPVIRPGRGRGELTLLFRRRSDNRLDVRRDSSLPTSCDGREGRISSGVIPTMAEREDEQSEAAQVAARTREAIAKKIATLVPKVEDDTEAQVVLHLAEAYAQLAIEPPRTRTR